MQGFINLNKQQGNTSQREITPIKHAVKPYKVGHLGTLDPMATGVLPVAIGKATRLFDYFLNKEKQYVCGIVFGVATDTLDATGQVVDTQQCNVTLAQLKKVLKKFEGECTQTPPMFSAKHVNGVRAYTLARKGEHVDLPAKKVVIHEINCQKQRDTNKFTLHMRVSAGTYVRSIVRDIAQELQTIAHMDSLERTASGVFTLQNASLLADVLQDVSKHILPIEQVVQLPHVHIAEALQQNLINGIPIVLPDEPQGECLVFLRNKLFGLAQIQEQGKLQILAHLFDHTQE